MLLLLHTDVHPIFSIMFFFFWRNLRHVLPLPRPQHTSPTHQEQPIELSTFTNFSRPTTRHLLNPCRSSRQDLDGSPEERIYNDQHYTERELLLIQEIHNLQAVNQQWTTTHMQLAISLQNMEKSLTKTMTKYHDALELCDEYDKLVKEATSLINYESHGASCDKVESTWSKLKARLKECRDSERTTIRDGNWESWLQGRLRQRWKYEQRAKQRDSHQARLRRRSSVD